MYRRALLACCLLPCLLFAEQVLIPRYREAERGVAEAQVEVGHYYVNQYAATQVGRNLSEARDWYGRAAKQGYPVGMLRLAELNLRREPEVHDPAEAHYWMDKLYEGNHPETGCNIALARFYAEGAPSRDGKANAAPEPARAYYHIVLQSASGWLPPDLTALRQRLRKQLTEAQVKDAEDRAFRWVEDHNKPALKLEGEGAPRDGTAKDGRKKDKDGKATTTDEPIDTADKALELAIKNQQESARQVQPLGKQKRYLLPTTDRDKK